ncbi:MAG: ABC transporter substrate-binding protein [Dehalococcoidia bacterium]|nr:MAG: ABC transporter substrate-binding protein [Dehalococcoidia bacterium]
MQMIKHIALILMAITLAFSLGACGKEEGPATTPENEENSTPESDHPVTITWSFWGDPWEVDVNMRVIQVFETDYPNIKVEIRHEPWSTYFDTAEEWLASDSPPDVMFLEDIPIYASRGLLENLEPYIDRDNYDLTDFYPGLLRVSTYQDSLYGLARDNDTKVIFYNKTLFDEAKLSYPVCGWSWEELRQTAIKLTEKEDGEIEQYGFAYEPDIWWRVWVWQNGGEVYDDDFAPTKTLLNSSEAIGAIQFLADLTNVDRVTPPYEVQRTSLGIGQLFQNGKLAMAFGNHALIPGFAATPGLRWDVVCLPQGKHRVNVAGGGGYVITAASRNKEAAWTFLKWLESPKGQAIFTESGIVVPARRSVGQADVFMKQQPLHNATVFLEETERGRPAPIFKGGQAAEAERLFDEAFKPVWEGEKSAREAVAEVVAEVNRLLGRD